MRNGFLMLLGLSGSVGCSGMRADVGPARADAGQPAAGDGSSAAAPRILFIDPVDPSGSLVAGRQYDVHLTGASDDGMVLAGVSSFGNLTLWPSTGANFYWTPASGVVRVDAQLDDSYVSSGPRVSPDGTALLGWYLGANTALYRWAKPTGYETFPLPPGTLMKDSFVNRDGTVALGVDSVTSRPFRWRRTDGLVYLPSMPGWPADAAYGVLDVSGLGLQAPCSDDGRVIAGYQQMMSDDYVLTSSFVWSETAPPGGVAVGLPGFDSCAITALSPDGALAVGGCFDKGTAVNGGGSTAFRWTASAGTVSLGNGFYSEISHDGLVAVGNDYPGALFRWTAESGPVTLQPASSAIDPIHWGRLRIDPGSLSDDGKAFHGSATRIDYQGGFDEEIPHQAFRWSVGEGFVPLLPLAGHDVSAVTAASPDGSVLAGVSRSGMGSVDSKSARTVVWDCQGPRDVAAELTAAGVDLHGVDLGWGEEVWRVWSGATDIVVVYDGTLYHSPWIVWLPRRC